MSLLDFFSSDNSSQSGFQQLISGVASAAETGYAIDQQVSSGAPAPKLTATAGGGIAAGAAAPVTMIFGVAWYWILAVIVGLALLGFGIYSVAR